MVPYTLRIELPHMTRTMPAETPPDDRDARPSPARRRRVAAVLLVLAVAGGLWVEAQYSPLQATVFHALASRAGWVVAPGEARHFRVPTGGPWNQRFGYSQLTAGIVRLKAAGFAVTAQSRQSGRFVDFMERGYYPIYREKTRGGLTVRDARGNPLYAVAYPERQYRSFDEIPPLLVDALLFVENRDLLTPGRPWRNPAVDWARLAQASLAHAGRKLDWDAPRFGASTLATQIEKYRHSTGGRTRDAGDKFAQMVSASLRSYLAGEDTRAARQQIVLDFLNTVPLGGFPGFGEVHGIGDGLWAWYGRDFAATSRVLRDPAAPVQARGAALRDALALLVAQRRPSALLGGNGGRLAGLTDSYLRLLGEAGLIDGALRDAALAARSAPHRLSPDEHRDSFVERKGVNDVRASLAGLLGLADFYTLDRLDLSAQAALDGQTQAGVAAFLERLSSPRTIECLGLRAPRMLARGDPAGVRYSFTLYESSPIGNLVRVQADNLDQPLDLNAGTKIDLGSSAKLRTLVSYLNAVAGLHGRLADRSASELASLRTRLPVRAALSRWAIDHLLQTEDRTLATMLAASLDRRYSADPGETFFTGGGVHRFNNFQREDDRKVPTVAEALAQSINLPFVRIMRDLVHYHAYEAEDAPARGLADGDDAVRQDFLRRFADYEGRQFLARFWVDYGKLADEDVLPALAARIGARPRQLAAAYWAVAPTAMRNPEDFAGFMRRHLAERTVAPETLHTLSQAFAGRDYSLADWGYLARRHPLELWLVRHLLAFPESGFAEAVAASGEARQDAARWLFAARQRQAQDVRIAITVEQLAFERLSAEWRQLGYPFDALVPSLATSIGSSADRPAALAELAGILLNKGRRLPPVRVERLAFAVGTPFETHLARGRQFGDQVLRPEVAAVARGAMISVVDAGTARRLREVYRARDGRLLVLGGKTGTGDHRYRKIGPGGERLSERVMNRAATFVFFLGDRHFGVMTAFVPGPAAGGYDFTSSLPVRLVAELEPLLGPLAGGKPGRPLRSCAADGAGGASRRQ